MQHLQGLALVFVEALDHDIQQVGVIDRDTVTALQHIAEVPLVGCLDGGEPLPEFGVFGERL